MTRGINPWDIIELALKDLYNLTYAVSCIVTTLCISISTAFAQTTTTTEQVILEENFSGSTFPAGWKTFNYNDVNSQTYYAWEIKQSISATEDVYTGSAMGLIKTTGEEASNLNIWAFTPGITMVSGTVYTVSFYHRNNGSGAASLSLAMNSIQHYSNALILASRTVQTTSGWRTNEYVTTYTVSGEGTVFLGLGITQMSGQIELYIDEIRVTASTGPMGGTYMVGTNGHYLKPETALIHLHQRGIQDTVRFDFTDPQYNIESNKRLTIGAYTGASSWPVYLKSHTPGSATIIGVPDKEALIYLNNANNVHLEGFSIYNSSTVNPWAVGINASSNCSVNGCSISAGSITAGNTGARGISIKDGDNIVVKNNMIHSILGSGVETNILENPSLTDNNFANLYGIVIDGTGQNHKVYNNSVSLTGERTASGSIAAAMAVAAGANGLDIRNNIFSNTQTTSAEAQNAKNYLIYSFAGKDAFAHLNYNLYYVDLASKSTKTALGYLAGNDAVIFSDWQAYTSKETSSMFGQPAFKSDTDLGMDPNHPNSWFANGTGLQLSDVAKDMANASRSTQIKTGGVDLGALEFTPTATAPEMVATNVPAAGERQEFYFAERLMAVVNWSATSSYIPQNFAIRYRPGQFVRDYPGGYKEGKLMNSWIEVVNGTQTDPETFSYDLEIRYDEALLGELVEDPSDFTLAQKNDPESEWSDINEAEFDFAANTITRRSVTSASYIAASDKLSTKPLPVTMLYFTASRKGEQGLLRWKTTQEQNNEGFEIQASTDGFNYASIGFVAAQNNQENSYSFNDTRANKSGILYYRLKQIDHDGLATFYGPSAIQYGDRGISLKAYPNPLATELDLAVEAASEEALLLTITNATGKEISREKVWIQHGLNVHRLQLPAGLPAGFYILSATWNQQTQVVKLIKR